MKVAVLVTCAVVLSSTRAHAQLDGRITITHAEQGGQRRSSAVVDLERWPQLGTVLASDGPCTVYNKGHRQGLSAGAITITGTTEPITLEESPGSTGVTYHPVGRVPNPAFADGAEISVAAAGGADVPAFSSSVTAPRALAGYTPPSSLSRTGYTATWTPDAGGEIMIFVVAVRRAAKHEAVVLCRVPDTGTFTVPASTFASIPPELDTAVLAVARVAETVQSVGDGHVSIEALSTVTSGPFSIGPPPVAPAPVAPPQPPVRPETTPRISMSVGLGVGGVSRNGATPPTNGSVWRFQLGQRLGHGLQLVEELDTLEGPYESYVGSQTSEVHSALGAGLRWTPLEPCPAPSMHLVGLFPGGTSDVCSFYLTAAIGANVRDRSTQLSGGTSIEASAWSPMASLALGIPALQGHDWSVSEEFREQVTSYDDNFQRGWMLLAVFQLNER